jgi:hypothetical protein
MERGDLVIYRNRNVVHRKTIDHFGIVLEVRNWDLSGREEEVFLKFPLDGSEGWYLSEKLEKVKLESENEQPSRPPEPLSFIDGVRSN